MGDEKRQEISEIESDGCDPKTKSLLHKLAEAEKGNFDTHC